MTVMGMIEQGRIVLATPVALPDGTRVEVDFHPVNHPAGSVAAILQALAQSPHLDDHAVSELETAIAEGRRPVESAGIFDPEDSR